MTKSEKQLIIEQGLPEELFIDANGKSVSQIEGKMKAMGKIFAFNSSPCE